MHLVSSSTVNTFELTRLHRRVCYLLYGDVPGFLRPIPMLGGLRPQDQEVEVSGAHQGQGGYRCPEDVQGQGLEISTRTRNTAVCGILL